MQNETDDRAKPLPLRAVTLAALLAVAAASGCVSTATDDCPGDSELINGQCVGVDEDGRRK